MPPNARYCISFLHEMINEKLEDQWMADIRLKEYSYCTEETYVTWHKRFELWQGKRHSSEMATPEVESFLTHLAVNLGLGAASQNQAFNALIFLSREVLGTEPGNLDARRAWEKARLPVVLSVEEMKQLLTAVDGLEDVLQARLFSECGLRVSEILSLRITGVDLPEERSKCATARMTGLLCQIMQAMSWAPKRGVRLTCRAGGRTGFAKFQAAHVARASVEPAWHYTGQESALYG